MARSFRTYLRQRLIPVGLWLVLSAVVAYLYFDVARHGQVMGFAQAIEYNVSPVQAGRVATVLVQVGENVRPGQPIVTLDVQAVDAELDIERARLKLIEASASHAASQSHDHVFRQGRVLAEASEASERALVKARSVLDVKTAELDATRRQVKALRKLLEQRMVLRKDVSVLEVKAATLEREVKTARRTTRLLRAQVQAAKRRLKSVPGNLVETSQAPMLAERALVEKRIRKLRGLRDASTLRAPAAGQVVAIHVREGGVARQGQPVISIVGDKTKRVVACVPEQRAFALQSGERATLYPHSGANRKPLHGYVLATSARINQVPLRCRSGSKTPSWGREVLIAVSDDVQLVAGQGFQIQFEDNGGKAAAAPAKQTKPKGSLRPLSVPQSINQASRFEPSGLVWSAKQKRYLIVSDDTGYKGDNNHAPWIFAMNDTGQVESHPVVIEGINKINDLEGIAQDQHGALYLMTSQSLTKKGKRKKARNLMIRAVAKGKGFVATHVVPFKDLLEQLSATKRQQLGFDTSQLDLEGLTYARGALYIGVKAPGDSQGRALIWRISNLDAFFKEQSLAKANLELWARVKLPIEADGQTRDGGIADLLFLPNGKLVIAATAAQGDPRHQTGALYLVASPKAGELTAKRFAAFPGRKPEGLSLAAEKGKLVVVFDEGARTPLWEKRSWP